MSNSIIVKLSLFSEEEKRTIKYLQKIGISCDKFKNEDINYSKIKIIYIVEFKNKPIILEVLENNDFLDKRGSIELSCINEYGVSFYIANSEFDGSIFVPMDNINCIHTIEKDKFSM